MTKLEGAGAGMAAAAGLVRTATVPLPSLSPDMLAEKGAAAATSAPSPISTRMPAAPVCPLIANQYPPTGAPPSSRWTPSSSSAPVPDTHALPSVRDSLHSLVVPPSRSPYPPGHTSAPHVTAHPQL